MILITVILLSISTSDLLRVVSAIVMMGTFLFALSTSRLSRRLRRMAMFAVMAMAVLAVASLFLASSEWIAGLISALVAGLVLLTMAAILRRIITHLIDRIRFNTVLAALCIYLLLGILFAAVFALVNVLDAPFFATTQHARSIDFVYFSYVTVATVGYGDLVARSDVGRMLSATEGLVGQLYLVSVVALLVGNLGRGRASVRAQSTDGDAGSDDPRAPG